MGVKQPCTNSMQFNKFKDHYGLFVNLLTKAKLELETIILPFGLFKIVLYLLLKGKHSVFPLVLLRNLLLKILEDFKSKIFLIILKHSF